ncbi:MAG: hypothetical protein CSA58_05620 [Micrococcales bacterium]|nr:MAG: hypothetical protein CSB46_04015 [Micrococcales bacterium]PIE27188.1 MAG: hypothetical protein CSA58_05620 [Micrococcales bacterium]
MSSQTVHSQHPQAPAQDANPPVSWARLGLLGLLLALLMGAAGAVLLRDAVIHAGWLDGRLWMPVAVEALPRIEKNGWLVAAGILSALLGLLLLIWALKPRRSVAVPVPGSPGVYVRGRAVEALAIYAARDVDGVHGVDANASKTAVAVRVMTTGDPGVGPNVNQAVRRALDGLGPNFGVKVKTRAVNG